MNIKFSLHRRHISLVKRFYFVGLITISFLFSACKRSSTVKEHEKNPSAREQHEQEAVIKKYILIDSKNGLMSVNKEDLINLDEPLKALAAYYGASYGSDCFNNHCELTEALNLGEQGSQEQKALIEKWFPKSTKLGRNPNGLYTLNSTGSVFEEYNMLSFERSGEFVKVEFSVTSFNHGESYVYEYEDHYKVTPSGIQIIQQQKGAKKIE